MMNITTISYRLAYAVVLWYILVALFSPFIANDKPILCIIGGKITCPILQRNVSTQDSDRSSCMMPPIPFDTKSIDHSINAGKSPFDKELQKTVPCGIG